MSELSKVVDKLVADYEAEQERKLASTEGQHVRALVQGMLAGSMMTAHHLKVAEVEMPKDEDGVYEPYFVVEMASGIRVRVSVDLDT